MKMMNKLFLVIILSVFILHTPDKVYGAVIYNSSNVGTSYNVSSYIFLSNAYLRFPFATSTFPSIPIEEVFTLPGKAETLRLKRISGVACSVPKNITLFDETGNGLGAARNGIENGDFCDFSVIGADAGEKFSGLAICVNNSCDNKDGDFVLDGSDTNAGYSFGAYNQMLTPGGVAFQLCDVDGCSGGFNLPPEPEADVCTENCNSSVLFLPGFQASKLYRGSDNEEIWLPGPFDDTDALLMNPDGTSVRSDMYVGDIIKTAYFVADIYKSFSNGMDDLVTSGVISDWKPFAYDWRYGVDTVVNTPQQYSTTTKSLVDTLRTLALNSRTKKVTIIAHSNGGLVAKYLVSVLGSEAEQLIDKLILVATPQIGTPQAIGGLLHGYDQGMPVSSGPFSFFSAKDSRVFGENAPGAYGLLPSSAYFSSGNVEIATSTIRFGEGDLLAPYRALYGQGIQDPVTLKSFLLGNEGRVKPQVFDLDTPNILNSTLLSKAENIHNITDSQIIPSGIEVDQIAGWGEKTLAGIDYYQGNKRVCSVNLSNCIVSSRIMYKPSLVIDGDGTVVAPSALYMSTSSPNIKRWWVNVFNYNDSSGSGRDHKDILEIPQLSQFIYSLISTSTLIVPDFISANQPESISSQSLEFYLHSPLDLSATDTSGNKISSTTTTIPNARYKRFGEVQYISIPSGINFKLSLAGYATGSFDLDVEKKAGNEILEKTYFFAIPIATTTTAFMEFSDGTIENASSLRVDYENDGITDLTLKPIVNETVTLPPVVLDTTAPEVEVIFSTTTNNIEIIGRDEITQSLIIEVNSTSTLIRDGAGNTISLDRKFKEKKNESRIDIAKLVYSTTTEMVVDTNSFARYFWLKNPRTSKYLIFVSHLKTPEDNIITVYDFLKNKTKIIFISKALNDIDLESVGKKLPKGAIIKKTVNGLVVPYLETKMGEVIIRY